MALTAEAFGWAARAAVLRRCGGDRPRRRVLAAAGAGARYIDVSATFGGREHATGADTQGHRGGHDRQCARMVRLRDLRLFRRHIGDRFGRRTALTFSVAAMAIPTFLIGLLPGLRGDRADGACRADAAAHGAGPVGRRRIYEFDGVPDRARPRRPPRRHGRARLLRRPRRWKPGAGAFRSWSACSSALSAISCAGT